MFTISDKLYFKRPQRVTKLERSLTRYSINIHRVDSGDVMGLVDVGMCMVHSITEVKNAIMSLVGVGRIGDFRVSEEGFSIRQIGVDHERSECRKIMIIFL